MTGNATMTGRGTGCLDKSGPRKKVFGHFLLLDGSIWTETMLYDQGISLHCSGYVFRPLSVFKPQTWVLSIQAPDLVCHCLNFRPGVSPTFLPTLCQLFANFLPLFANFSLFLNFSTLLQTFPYLVAGVAWRRYLPRRASLAFQLAFPGTCNLLIPDICIFYCLFKLFVSTVF